MWLSRMIAALGIVVLMLSAKPIWSQQKLVGQTNPARAEAGATDSDRERLQRLDSMKRAAAEYEVSLETPAKDKLKLQPEPALRWTNPVRGTTDGAVFIWLVNGRPELAGGIYKWSSNPGEPDMEHELTSLTVGKTTAMRGGRTVWKPAKPGIELQPIPAAAMPAGTAALRLVQLRSLAREFSAFHDDPAASEELRLLPQPIYRYEKTSPELLDGALFAFVQATDPEVLLVIESCRDEAGHQWQYG